MERIHFSFYCCRVTLYYIPLNWILAELLLYGRSQQDHEEFGDEVRSGCLDERKEETLCDTDWCRVDHLSADGDTRRQWLEGL